MVLAELQSYIDNINHSKASRADAVTLVIDNPEFLPELLAYAFSKAKNAHKVCWWLEFLNRQDIEVLCPYIHELLDGAKHLKNDSAIRPFARIIETFCLNNYSKMPNKIVKAMMTPEVKERFVELSFHWLIDNELKVAPKAYSMISLYHLGKDVSWVHSELQLIIEQNYGRESAAYKARARMVLKKLKH